jgi:two-component system phosphate regulon sensor histidine kinase PhoR
MEEQIKRKEAEEALLKSEAEMRTRAERLTHFLTVASHELRQPTTIIKGYTSILSAGEVEMTENMVGEFYETINKAADRLTRLVDELMDVSLIEGKKFHIETKPVHPQYLCEDAREEMKRRGFQNKIEIDIPDGTTTITVDPDKFYELLVILLDNACNYSDASSSVLVRIQGETGGVALAVMDRGPGIPEADRERIFERFYQVVDALHHSKPGTGLGLYIASQIVEAHGGKIWCEPREGGGSVFLVTLG